MHFICCVPCRQMYINGRIEYAVQVFYSPFAYVPNSTIHVSAHCTCRARRHFPKQTGEIAPLTALRAISTENRSDRCDGATVRPTGWSQPKIGGSALRLRFSSQTTEIALPVRRKSHHVKQASHGHIWKAFQSTAFETPQLYRLKGVVALLHGTFERPLSGSGVSRKIVWRCGSSFSFSCHEKLNNIKTI